MVTLAKLCKILHFLEQSHEAKKINKLENLVLSRTSLCLTLKSLIKTVASIIFERFKLKLTLSFKHAITSGPLVALVKSKSEITFPSFMDKVTYFPNEGEIFHFVAA